MPEPTYQAGAVLRVNRPAKQYHGYLCRFIEPSQDTALVWVAFAKKVPAVSPPDERTYRRRDHAEHKLLPLSQLTSVLS